MKNETFDLTPAEQRYSDFILMATNCIRDGWTLKDLKKDLDIFCKEEEQICDIISDAQRYILNNNPEAFPLVRKNKKGFVIEVAVAEPTPTDEHPDKAIVTVN